MPSAVENLGKKFGGVPANGLADTALPDSRMEAASYISHLEHRQGLQGGGPEEVAWRLGGLMTPA